MNTTTTDNRGHLPRAAIEVLSKFKHHAKENDERLLAIIHKGPIRTPRIWINDDDVRAIRVARRQTDLRSSAAMPMVRTAMQRALVPLMLDRILARYLRREIGVLSVTILAQRFNVPTRDLEFDLAGVKRAVRNVFGRDDLSHIGFVEVAMVTTGTGLEGHDRFDQVYPHWHGLVWGEPAAIRRFRELIPRRGEKLRAGPCNNPPIVARRVGRTEADLARVAAYMVKADRCGNRIANGRWSRFDERVPLATVLDNFRILNRHKLPELMIAKGEGLDLRQELVFGPDRRRRNRIDGRPDARRAGDAGSAAGWADRGRPVRAAHHGSE